MRIIAISLVVFFMFCFSITADGQKNLVVMDKAQFMNSEIENILRDRLISDSVNLTSIFDTRKRCDYIFANLAMDGTELKLSLFDCNDRSAGSRNLGSRILTAADSEKALLLYFSLSELLKGQFKNFEAAPQTIVPPSDSVVQTVTDPGQHKSRYFFAPSSYNLKKGDIYYNSLYFLVHDVQYGVSDQFSMGMGTTIFGFPFYLTPKLTIPVSERSSFAIGDMFMVGTWGAKFTGNLLYTTFTTGGSYNNITLGGGYLYVGGKDISDPLNALLINVSTLLRLSDNLFFISENYGSKINITQTAFRYDQYSGESFYQEFKRNIFFIYGLTGLRFINRNKDIKSWQFGLSYVLTARGEIPGMYNFSSWDIENRSRSEFIAFPVIGYARKFTTK